MCGSSLNCGLKLATIFVQLNRVFSRPKAGFQTGCSLLKINVSVSPSFFAQVEAKRQILGPSGDIPQIKTALDDVSHRKKTCGAKILTGSGDFHLCTLCKLTKIRRKCSDCKFKILARDGGVFCSQTIGKHSRKALEKDSRRKTSKT